MQCPICQADNPPTAVSCLKCTTPLPFSDQTLGATAAGGTSLGGASSDATSMGNAVPGGTAAWSVAVTPPASASAAQGEQLVGTLLAERYEIISLLGQGGMGAVYKAHDIELERMVAIKLIRPDLASNPEILRRFKQELILAREVTHRNVIRIFDLGQAKGFKFITMEFVEGRDLRALLRERGKLPPEEAVRIISQVCRALESAHAAGVVHRDLKPQNIMLDPKDRVYVMDFGIAHSLETPGMTQTGALMGTPEYMSPEQAKGIKVDARSDLFALGIILYELLTGISPYKADNALAMLLKRTQERPQPPTELDPTIPKPISDAVMKCLEIDRDQRYSNAREILEDLGLEMPTSVRTVAPTFPPLPAAPKAVSPLLQYRNWIIAGAAVFLFAVIGFAFRGKIFSSKGAPVEQASLAILPFRNASGDAALNWIGASLAEMLRTDVGQSADFHTVSADRLHQILADLRISPDAELAPGDLQRVSDFTNANLVVWGQYVKIGSVIRIDATLQDLKRQRTTPLMVEAPDEKAILKTVDQLAQSIQANLSLGSAVVQEMKAAAFTPSSLSVEALRYYSQGLELARQGNHLEAVKQFEAATRADPNFALAYSVLGQTYARLGYGKEAEQFSSRAADLSGNLPAAEKYMIQAANFRIENNNDKALEAYENLIKLMPNDPNVESELAALYDGKGAYDKAFEYYGRALQNDPKNVDALVAIGWVQIERGHAQASLDYLNRALSLAVELDNKQGKASALQAIGAAYLSSNKLDDALQNLQQALALQVQTGDKKGTALSLRQIADVFKTQGKTEESGKKYQEALKLEKEIGDQAGLGGILLNYGDLLVSQGKYDEALNATQQALHIEVQLGDESTEAICLNDIGNINLRKGRYDEALTYFQQGLSLRQKLKVPGDIAMSLNNIGLTYLRLNQFDKALDNYLHALDVSRSAADRSGVAATSDSMALLFEIQGRYGAALSAEQEALNNIQQMQEQSSYLAETQADYGEALTLAGRGDEAQKSLDEALALARSLQNNALVGKILNFQGERFLYRGDFKSARPLFLQALQVASREKDPGQILTIKINLARIDIREGHAPIAISSLKTLAKDTETSGMKYLSMECSLYLGEALVGSKDYTRARQELETTVQRSQSLAMKSLLPQAHYWLALALRGSGKEPEAANHIQQAGLLLEEMHKESHSEALLKRDDLRPIAEEASHKPS